MTTMLDPDTCTLVVVVVLWAAVCVIGTCCCVDRYLQKLENLRAALNEDESDDAIIRRLTNNINSMRQPRPQPRPHPRPRIVRMPRPVPPETRVTPLRGIRVDVIQVQEDADAEAVSTIHPIKLRRLNTLLFEESISRPGTPLFPPLPGTADANTENPEPTEPTEPTESRRGVSMCECVICLDLRATVVVMSCGHGCMCLACARKVWRNQRKCPLCRGPAEDMAHVLDVSIRTDRLNAVRLFMRPPEPARPAQTGPVVASASTGPIMVSGIH